MRVTRRHFTIPVCLLALPAPADVVHLRNGGRVEGRVTDRGETLEVETRAGRTTVEKSAVDRIEAKPWAPPSPEERGSRTPPADGRPLGDLLRRV